MNENINKIIIEVYKEYGPYDYSIAEYYNIIAKKLNMPISSDLKHKIIRKLKTLIKNNSSCQEDIMADYYEGVYCLNQYLKDLENIPKITDEEEKKLFIEAQNGNKDARNRIVENHLKIVNIIALKYINMGLDYEELIQEGSIGLMQAVNSFDINKQVKFNFYATYYIKTFIKRAIVAKSTLCNIPAYEIKNYLTFIIAVKNLTKVLERKPSLAEIKEVVSLPLELVNKYYALLNIENINTTYLLDENDLIEQATNTIALRIELENLFAACNLSLQKREIIHKLYHSENEAETIIELANKYNVTPNAIRNSYADALRMIRQSEAIKSLVPFTNDPKDSLEHLELFQEIYKITSRNSYYQMDTYEKLMAKKKKVLKL